MSELRLGPALYAAEPEAMRGLGDAAARLGSSPVIVHGSSGLAAVEAARGPLLAGVPRILHEGPCTARAIRRAADRAAQLGSDVIVAVGGGRVLDVGKAVAEDVGAAVVTVPTSPATCAAVTALSVLYSEDGRWFGGRPLHRAPDATVVDLTTLSRAPRRLLGAGVLDALAKVHEVRLILARSPANSVGDAVALSLCAVLDERLAASLTAALGDAPDNEAVMGLSEAVLSLPGWIGGFAGEANKVAAAHAVHNGLTSLPGSKTALHGELVGFGVVVQMVLAGRDPTPVLDVIELCRAPCGLTALGCQAYLDDPAARTRVVQALLAYPTFVGLFPEADEVEIDRALREADRRGAARTGHG